MRIRKLQPAKEREKVGNIRIFFIFFSLFSVFSGLNFPYFHNKFLQRIKNPIKKKSQKKIIRNKGMSVSSKQPRFARDS